VVQSALGAATILLGAAAATTMPPLDVQSWHLVDRIKDQSIRL
jgi:hypothetical protein